MEAYTVISTITTLSMWVSAILFTIFFIKDTFDTRRRLNIAVLITCFWIICDYVLESTYADDIKKAVCDFHIDNTDQEDV